MAAGTAYSKRYAAGFVDKPTLTTPIDSTSDDTTLAAWTKYMPGTTASVWQAFDSDWTTITTPGSPKDVVTTVIQMFMTSTGAYSFNAAFAAEERWIG